MRQRDFKPAVAALASLLCLTVVGGCAKEMGTPRDRPGALPVPGLFTFYSVVDPDHLGPHRYERNPRWFHEDEGGHGILYTTRAGFLDMDHVRITLDTVRYTAHEVREAIRQRRDSVMLRTTEGSTFEVLLRYPPSMRNASKNDPQSERRDDELAIRIGQRVTFLMMTWHEVMQWYGYRTFVLVDERPSAFSYDDPMAHVIGIAVAGRALRDNTGRSFDDAATDALRAELTGIGAVKPEQTQQAVHAVEGIWWSNGKPLKRQLDVGLNYGGIHPWLIPNLPFANGSDKVVFSIPTLSNINGQDFSGFYSVRIDPKVRMGEVISESLPGHPTILEAERDFSPLIEGVRRQMKQQLAGDVDQPWPVAAVAESPGPRPPRAAGDGVDPANGSPP